MSMTRRERAAKEQIMKILKKEGYVTYAKLLSNFDVNLTTNPQFVDYIDLRTGVMVLNEGLDIEVILTCMLFLLKVTLDLQYTKTIINGK